MTTVSCSDEILLLCDFIQRNDISVTVASVQLVADGESGGERRSAQCAFSHLLGRGLCPPVDVNDISHLCNSLSHARVCTRLELLGVEPSDALESAQMQNDQLAQCAEIVGDLLSACTSIRSLFLGRNVFDDHTIALLLETASSSDTIE